MIDLNLAAIVGQEGQPLSSKLTPGAIVAPHRGQYGLAVISSNAALQPLQNPLRTSTSLPHAEQVSVHTSWKADCRIFLPAERIRFVFLISSCVISEDGSAKSFSGNSVAMSKRDFSIGIRHDLSAPSGEDGKVSAVVPFGWFIGTGREDFIFLDKTEGRMF